MSFRSSERDIAWIVVAKSTSWLGDAVAMVALTLRLQSHGAAAVATLLIANALPIVALAGVAGRLVDRLDSRTLLITSSLVQAAACGLLVAQPGIAAVLALVAVLGASQVVNGATWQALLAAVAGADRLPRAVGLAQAAQNVAGIAAPAFAGLLIGWYSARVPLAVDAVAYVAVAAVAAGLVVTRRRVAPPVPGTRALGGLAIVRSDALLRPLFVLLGVFVLLGSMVNVVEVFLVRETLGASATWYGLAGAVYAVGMLVGALLAGRLRGAPVLAKWFVASSAALSASLAVIAAAPSVGWLLVPMASTGVGNGALNVTLGSLVLGRTSPDERGRVSALLSGTASGTQLVAYAAGGALLVALTPREVFLVSGVLGVLAPLVAGRGVLRASSDVAVAGDDSACLPARATANGSRRTFRGAGAWVPHGARASGRRCRARSRG